MSQRTWKSGFVASAIGIVILLVIGLGFAWASDDKKSDGTGNGDDTTTEPTGPEGEDSSDADSADESDDASDEDATKDSDAPSGGELQALMAQIEEDLTVNPEDILPERAKCETDEFIPNSLAEVRAGDPAFRQWSDSVSIPFASQDKDEMLDEMFAENCGNPTVLDMNIQALNRMTLLGFNVGENNPWMGEFLDAVESDGLREAFLTKKGGNDDIYVTAEFQRYAAMTNTILLAFQNLGVMSDLVSSENWHVEGPVAGELPRTVLNPTQEGLPALVFEYTVKDNCSLVRFGFNTQDKRFELFVTPVCEEVPPTTEEPPCECPPPGTVPPCKGCPPPTTTLPPCPNCTTTTTTTVPQCPECTTTTTVPPTTTVPCGNKNVRDPETGECVPNIPSGSTLPPPATTTPTATTVQPAPQPPTPTAPPDTLPQGVTPTTYAPDPPVVPYVPPGGTATTTPVPTVAPPAPPPPNPVVTNPAPTPPPP